MCFFPFCLEVIILQAYMENPATPRLFRIRRIVQALRLFDWKYVLIEFAIVVAGILAAFAWNAYWERRTDNQLAHEYLEQIVVELKASEADLESVTASMRRRVFAAAQLSRASFSAKPPSEDELRRWMLTNMAYETPNITIGTLRTMVQSGDINLITEREFKTQLSVTADRVAAYDLWWRTQITEWILPAWHDIQPFALFTALQLEITLPDSVTARAKRDTTYLLPDEPRIQSFPVNLTAELRNRDFHDVVLDTYVARRDLLNRTLNIRNELSTLREDLEAWLLNHQL